MMIVVRQGGVIVILASGNTNTSGAVLSTLEDIVIESTEEAVLSQSELIASFEPPRAGTTTKALHVIDLSFRSHHIVIFAKTPATLVALCAEQSVTYTKKRYNSLS